MLFSELRFHNEEDAYRYVESEIWPNGAVCPRCNAARRVGRLNGSSTRIGTYKCYGCRKPFTVKIKTIFERSHVLMHVWLKAIALLCLGRREVGVQDLEATLEVSPRTAAYIAARIRRAMKQNGEVPPIGQTLQQAEKSNWTAIEIKSRLPLGPPRFCGRETTAARRMRVFVEAITEFDCQLSQSDFDQIFRAIAPPKAVTSPGRMSSDQGRSQQQEEIRT
jgi:transposase-like protein